MRAMKAFALLVLCLVPAAYVAGFANRPSLNRYQVIPVLLTRGHTAVHTVIWLDQHSGRAQVWDYLAASNVCAEGWEPIETFSESLRQSLRASREMEEDREHRPPHPPAP